MKASIINKLKEINEKISNYLYMIEQAKQINHRHEHSISISENNFFGIAEHYEGRIKINNKIIMRLSKRIRDLTSEQQKILQKNIEIILPV